MTASAERVDVAGYLPVKIVEGHAGNDILLLDEQIDTSEHPPRGGRRQRKS